MDNLIITKKNNNIEPSLLPPRMSVARKQFVLNILSNVAYQGVYIAVSLWMTPFLISYLGIAAFGMIPLVNIVASYMGVFTDALNIAVSRFLAIDIGGGNDEAANKTFNTALFGLIGIIVALTPVSIAVSIFFSSLFQVPLGWEKDVSWLFAMVAVAFFVSVISGVFSLSPFIHSRFLLSNIVNMISLVARVGVVFVLYTSLQTHIWYAGGGILISVLVSLIGYLILWRKLTPQLHIQISDFDRSHVRSLSGLGGWTLVNTVGMMLLSRVDLIVVNAYFGSIVTGGYGAIVQLSLLIENLMTTASTVIRPVLLLKYSQGDFLGLRDVAVRSVKLFGLALALPVGLMCGFSRPILSIWLGPSFTYLSLLLVILVSWQSLSLSVRPLAYVHNAYNKVRWPGIVTLISGVANLAVDILLAQWGKWGYIGIAVSTAVIWTAKNAIYMPIYTSRITGQPWWYFLTCLRWSIIGTLFAGLASLGLTSLYMPNNLISLALSAILIALVYTGVVWVVGLDHSDRQLLIDLFPLKKSGVVRNPVKG